MKIPKILHQIWIGERPPPLKCMNTWRDKHPESDGWQYILWNEAELEKRGIKLECLDQIKEIPEINGKADIIRWEILYQMGGYFVDADSICIEPFDDFYSGVPYGFATYENEKARKGLVATGTMGFIPKSQLCRDILDWIKGNPEATELIKKTKAWYSVGPGLLTRMLETGLYTEFSVYPSYCFLPSHFTGEEYMGHKKVYAYQIWGTGENRYANIDDYGLPEHLKTPPDEKWVSVLISSYNTKAKYIKECLDSLKNQEGHFGMELVWINDGSDDQHSVELEALLAEFEKRTRFTRVKYHKFDVNRGIGFSLNTGIQKCSYEIILKMDSDDICFPNRFQKQIEFMEKHPLCTVLGTNIKIFQDTLNDRKKIISETRHPERFTWSDFQASKSTWFMNHPTLCFRRSAVLEVGNYNPSRINKSRDMLTDIELELKMLKHYGAIYNLPEALLYYRIHDKQITFECRVEEDKLTEKSLADIFSEILS